MDNLFCNSTKLEKVRGLHESLQVAIISVRESRDPEFIRSGGNSVVASATASGNSICVAQLSPDIRCQ